MNLYDIVRRPDPSVSVEGEAKAGEPTLPGGRMRAVTIAPSTRIVIKDARGITVLSDFPNCIQWAAFGEDGSEIAIRIESNGRIATLATIKVVANAGTEIWLDWPLWAASVPFDLVLETTDAGSVTIANGPLFDSRRKIRTLAEGRGLEVGAGIRPLILPSAKVDVEYVEERSPTDWVSTYAKQAISLDHLTPEILDRYRVGSALTLENWEDDSLDFIFSNHVFEHLMNPIQVLRNWLGKLKSGGRIIGAIPDARFTFDLRQPLTELIDFEHEAEEGSFELPFSKYERWCRYTAPNAKPEGLKSRGYSVHIHNYTPANFRGLCQLATKEEFPALFLDHAPNNKDFGFALWKA